MRLGGTAEIALGAVEDRFALNGFAHRYRIEHEIGQEDSDGEQEESGVGRQHSLARSFSSERKVDDAVDERREPHHHETGQCRKNQPFLRG